MAHLERANVASGSDMGSLAAVWAYILPALDHIMRSNPSSTEAPPLDVKYHMGVYTVVYNFATASRAGDKAAGGASSNSRMGMGIAAHGFNLGLGLPGDDDDGFGGEGDDIKDWGLDRSERIKSMVGYELYEHLEEYFRGVARDVRDRAPNHDADFLPYYLASWTRYASGVAIINRLFAYLNRHFITRAVDEGMGWISIVDVLKDHKRKKSKKDIEILEARKKEELKKWGFNGGSPEQRRFAESCAEAGSSSDRIVPVASLAHRCWRSEVVEPFLSSGVPKAIMPAPPPEPESEQASPLKISPGKSKSSSILDNPSTTTTPPTSKSKKNKKKKKSAKDKGKGKEEDISDNADNPIIDDPTATPKPMTNGTSNGTPNPPPAAVPPPPPPIPAKGRLNRAVGDLVTVRPPAPAPAKNTALRLSKSLRQSGVGGDNLIRKRLDKFLKG